MKTGRRLLGRGGSGLMALALAVQLGSVSLLGAEVPKKEAPVKAVPAATQEEENLGLGDPFKYTDSLGGDLSPLLGSKQVGAIEIKGIINVEGDKPRALLSLKETGRMYYVSKGDVIRVNAKVRAGSLPMEAYIVVKDVREEEVELIQQERPDKVIIIR